MGVSRQGAATLGWERPLQVWLSVSEQSQVSVPERESPLWLGRGQDEGRQDEFKAFGP